MKFSKYIAILAAFAAAAVASAQTAPAASPTAEPKVTTTLNDGVLGVRVEMNVQDPTVSCEDAIKRSVDAALKVTGRENMSSRAVEASMGSILAAITDRNAPARGNVNSTINVKTSFSGGQPVLDAVSDVEIAGEKYHAKTRTLIAADSSTNTQGNVTVTTDRGERFVVPVTFAVDPQGNTTGSAGERSVATTTRQAVATELLVTPAPRSEEAHPVPDPTIVTSKDK